MLIPLKLLHDQPLQQQLYDQLRELVVSARLAPGVRMPSSRMLADQFAVSRMTVLLAYERLIAEGYLETVPAVGTFVGKPSASHASRPDPHAAQTIALPVPASNDGIGQPDPSLFPTGRWRALMRGTLERFGAHIAQHHHAGSPALRAAIARWLSTSRGLPVQPEQIILAGGRQQALHMATHLLLRPGARAVLEDPCEESAASLYAAAQADIIRVPVDADGICTDRLPQGPAALVHVTPEHHRPLGAALSADRRQHLLDWAVRAGAMVLEEDSQGEFRYAPLAAPPLMNLDREGRVVHVGCFASTLGPWLTLAYLRSAADRRPRAVAGGRRAGRTAGQRCLCASCAPTAEGLSQPAGRADRRHARSFRRYGSPVRDPCRAASGLADARRYWLTGGGGGDRTSLRVAGDRAGQCTGRPAGLCNPGGTADRRRCYPVGGAARRGRDTVATAGGGGLKRCGAFTSRGRGRPFRG